MNALLCTLVLFFIIYAHLTVADAQFSFPHENFVVFSGTFFSVSISESGSLPHLTEMSTYVMSLYSGSNCQPMILSTIPSIKGNYDLESGSHKVSFQAPPNNTGSNSFFLGVTSSLKSNGSISVTNYSQRFSIQNQETQFIDESTSTGAQKAILVGPQRMFTCNNIPCKPSLAQLQSPEVTSTSTSTLISPTPSAPPNTTISPMGQPTGSPPTPQDTPRSSNSALKTYLGVIGFAGAFFLMLAIGLALALGLKTRRKRSREVHVTGDDSPTLVGTMSSTPKPAPPRPSRSGAYNIDLKDSNLGYYRRQSEPKIQTPPNVYSRNMPEERYRSLVYSLYDLKALTGEVSRWSADTLSTVKVEEKKLTKPRAERREGGVYEGRRSRFSSKSGS